MEPAPYDERIFARYYSFPVLVQPKLNGERAWANVKHGVSCTLYSSTGLELPSVPHINAEMQKFSTGQYDGELYNPIMNVQDIHSIVSRKENIHPNAYMIKLYLFDLIEDEDADSRQQHLSYIWSRNEASYIDSDEEEAYIRVMPIKYVYTHADIWILLSSYMEMGAEGIIIRNNVATYTPGKAPQAIMKYKPKKQDEYQIVGFQEEVDKYGYLKGTLGSFLLKDTRGHIFKSGSGLTKDQREHYWYHREQYRGFYALIEYPELTKYGIPSQPIFKEIRKKAKNV
jgi:ATP-dependent DNA ligase